MTLNPQQQQAVEHVHGPLLVLAGPGSGKTRVLVHRIAHLLGTGQIFPSQILSVTFTNKAAGEMRRRVEGLVGAQARDIAMGTFHSVCLRLLRQHGVAIGLGERFVVYDDADQLALIKECLSTLDIDRDRFPPRSFLERISRAKDACLSPEAFSAQAQGNPYLEKITKVYDRYQKRLGELQAADFGDLIRLVVKLFEENPALVESYQRRWQYILVDEYQDTNHAQYRLLRILAEKHQNICVVGDDDQSIYRWRGADLSNILRFEDDFADATVVRLEQNYRSTRSILDTAQAVVSKNAARKPKRIWTAKEGGAKVAILSCESERREALAIASRIGEARARGMPYKGMAIFYRTNAQSRPLEEIFREKGIPYRIYGGIRFYERAEVKDVLAYLKLLADPNDDMSFLRIINVPARGLGKTSVNRLKAFAAERGSSLFASLEPFVQAGSVRGAQARSFSQFRTTIDMLHQEALTKPLHELLKEVLEKTGFVEEMAQSSSLEAEAKLENINELVAAVEEFVPFSDLPPLLQFLDQVALVSDADAIDETMGSVTLMTLHIAKGLEFPLVFMVGLEEGLLPHARALDDPDELEEERRLCYVGMTRAMDQLTLSHAFRRTHFGQAKYNVVSRFVDDVPEEHAVRIALSHAMPQVNAFRPSRGSGHMLRKRQWSGEGDDPDFLDDGSQSRMTNHQSRSFDDDFDQRPPEERGSGTMIGMRVSHPTFGVGVIKGCQQTSAGHKVTVHFQSGTVKKLIAELAQLTPLG